MTYLNVAIFQIPADHNKNEMDQLSDYHTFKRLLNGANISWHYTTPYNFTGAGRILHEFEGDFFTLHQFTTVFLLTFYIPIFVAGLIGNLLIIASVIEDRNIRKARNCFLLNLAIADLSVTIFCMPAAVGTLVYRLWIYGAFLCKFTIFMQGEYQMFLRHVCHCQLHAFLLFPNSELNNN